MRVISCVPSWTETLIEAGVEVVGRTRFCIHPQEKVQAIQVVGGTKDIQWQKVMALKPDILILDQEENPESFFKESPCECLVTHVKDLSSMAEGLSAFGTRLQNQRLHEWAKWAVQLDGQSFAQEKDKKFPFALEALPKKNFESILYLIWAKPFMSVSKETYIGSILEKFSLNNAVADATTKYPIIDLQNFDPQKTLLLLSTEPYPFAKKRESISAEWSTLLVDGEKFSWYGLRGLRALAEMPK